MHVRHEALLDPPAVLVDLVQVLQLIIVAAAHDGGGGDAPGQRLPVSATGSTRSNDRKRRRPPRVRPPQPRRAADRSRRGSNFLGEVGELPAASAPWRPAAAVGGPEPGKAVPAGASEGKPLASFTCEAGQSATPPRLYSHPARLRPVAPSPLPQAGRDARP